METKNAPEIDRTKTDSPAGGDTGDMEMSCGDQQPSCSGSSDGDDLTFLDVLPWHDIIFRHILPLVDLPSLFRFGGASHHCYECVDAYFRCCPVINLCRVPQRISIPAFIRATHHNAGLQTLMLWDCLGWLNDGLLVPVFNVATKLTTLDLTSCTALSNASIHKLAISCPKLKHLVLRECHWLNAEGVTLLAMNCRKLERLDLTRCWQLDDESITVLVTLCSKSLIHISLAQIYGLTDQSIMHLARGCTNLQHLNIHGCWRVTDESIRFLCEYCPRLRSMQVRDCRDITEASLGRARMRGIRVDIPKHPWKLNPATAKYLQTLKLQV